MTRSSLTSVEATEEKPAAATFREQLQHNTHQNPLLLKMNLPARQSPPFEKDHNAWAAIATQ